MALPNGAARSASELLELGVVGRAHGLRGECHIQAWHPESPLWRTGMVFHVRGPSEAGPSSGSAPGSSRPSSGSAPGSSGPTAPAFDRTLRALRARRVPDGDVVVAFEGITTREAAEALRGHVLAVPPESLPAPDTDEVYHHEVVGWQVVDTAGGPLGVVTGLMSLPAQDVLAIQTTAGRQALVPFVAAIVTTIDRAARRLVLDPPEGLLDADAAEEDAREDGKEDARPPRKQRAPRPSGPGVPGPTGPSVRAGATPTRSAAGPSSGSAPGSSGPSSGSAPGSSGPSSGSAPGSSGQRPPRPRGPRP